MVDPAPINNAASCGADLSNWLNAFGTIAAVFMTWIVYRGQRSLSKELANQQERLSKELAAREERLAQRQLIVPLWEYLSNIPDIRPRDGKTYIEPDIIKAVNSLELIALCCEGKMIDETVILRTFSDGYIRIFDIIKAVPRIECRHGISGVELLNENKAAMNFYKSLMDRRMKVDQLTS